MITNAKRSPKDPGVVLATGPKYDLERVMTVASAFIDSLAKQVGRHMPEGPGRVRYGYSGRPVAYGAGSTERMKRNFRERAKRFEVDDYECRFEFGGLGLRARLLGYDALHALALAFKTIDGGEASTLDVAPVIAVYRRDHDGSLMTDPQRRLVTRLCDAASSQGVTADRMPDGLVKPVCFLNFPHAVFGAGEGPIRIRLVR